ncbi:MAG: hypothetical protein PHH27_03380, partial [Candidatus Colwellbacteria bacterium]|nr:hypothetical protein [Candidatus Colwellbacteria bacterium]
KKAPWWGLVVLMWRKVFDLCPIAFGTVGAVVAMIDLDVVFTPVNITIQVGVHVLIFGKCQKNKDSVLVSLADVSAFGAENFSDFTGAQGFF